MSVNVVHVAVGVLIDKEGKILLSKRGNNQHQGGLWEFPGGKVEPDESVFDALVREFIEEVDVRILYAEPLLQIKHDYGDKQVLLDVWLSRQPNITSEKPAFDGVAQGKESQLIAWVDIENLTDYDFPQANDAIIDHLKNITM
jgi:8-oxo-dGTP diphosphatase